MSRCYSAPRQIMKLVCGLIYPVDPDTYYATRLPLREQQAHE